MNGPVYSKDGDWLFADGSLVIADTSPLRMKCQSCRPPQELCDHIVAIMRSGADAKTYESEHHSPTPVLMLVEHALPQFLSSTTEVDCRIPMVRERAGPPHRSSQSGPLLVSVKIVPDFSKNRIEVSLNPNKDFSTTRFLTFMYRGEGSIVARRLIHEVVLSDYLSSKIRCKSKFHFGDKFTDKDDLSLVHEKPDGRLALTQDNFYRVLKVWLDDVCTECLSGEFVPDPDLQLSRAPKRKVRNAIETPAAEVFRPGGAIHGKR